MELLAIYHGLKEEITTRFPNTFYAETLQPDTNDYRFKIKSDNKIILVILLSVGIMIHQLHTPDDRLFLYEDADSIENTINYINKLLS